MYTQNTQSNSKQLSEVKVGEVIRLISLPTFMFFVEDTNFRLCLPANRFMVDPYELTKINFEVILKSDHFITVKSLGEFNTENEEVNYILNSEFKLIFKPTGYCINKESINNSLVNICNNE